MSAEIVRKEGAEGTAFVGVVSIIERTKATEIVTVSSLMLCTELDASSKFRLSRRAWRRWDIL